MVGILPAVADVTKESTGVLPILIVSILMTITVLPELLLIFPGYRKEIGNGIKDGDGQLDREDMKYFVSWYGPFSCLRVIIFFSLYSMVEPSWKTPSELIWSLVAISTGTAIPQIKKMFGK